MSFIRVLVVDDSARWQLAILKRIETESDLKIVAQAGDGSQAVQKAAALQPDIVVMDLALPLMSGLEATRRIRSTSPNSKVLFLSQHGSQDFIDAAYNAGACGYILKSDAASDLIAGIRAILENKKYLSHSLRGARGPLRLDTP